MKGFVEIERLKNGIKRQDKLINQPTFSHYPLTMMLLPSQEPRFFFFEPHEIRSFFKYDKSSIYSLVSQKSVVVGHWV